MKANKVLGFVCCFFTLASAFEYPRNFPGYFSQHGQDKLLNEQIFMGKKSGVFVEVGAHDGISFSNTYFFEKELNWKGICVEPIPKFFEQLKANRDCICENVCIDDWKGKKYFLKCSGYITEMYSGILDYLDPRHKLRIDNEILEFGGDKEIIEVDCITLHELLKINNIREIDLLSLDVEGAEQTILQSINFNEVRINVILVENNFNEDHIRAYLRSKGYQFITRIGKDDIFQQKQ